ncbi:unnamed protein product, partial [Vitis vinifera]|uniref:Uncharacterized protein n=1 Tax=Vitis vinifera TaxID=29760 RepID=D7TA57_VITVI
MTSLLPGWQSLPWCYTHVHLCSTLCFLFSKINELSMLHFFLRVGGKTRHLMVSCQHIGMLYHPSSPFTLKLH